MNRPERIDWGRVVDGEAPPAPARRAPFRFGGDGGPPEGSEHTATDPWKELLERGSMQEVLASVRRVSGLPEEPEPQPDPPKAKPAARPPAPRSERPTAPEAPRPPAVAKRSPAAAAQRPRAKPGPERPAPPTSPGHDVPAAAPRDSKGVPGEPPDRSPTETPRAEPRTGAPQRTRKPGNVDRAPAEAPVRERASSAKPALVLSEMADRDRADTIAAAGPAPHGFTPDLVPRRSALHDVPKRREVGPLGAIALLVLALAIGIGFGFAVDADSWNLPWRFAAERAAPEPVLPLDAPADPAPEPAPVPAAPAPAAAEAADERSIPVPKLRPTGPAEILIEEIGGIRTQGLADQAAPPAEGPATGGGQAANGEEVAAAEILRGDVDRVAPLFLGRVYVHYAEAANDPDRRGRALAVARRLEESGYRIGGVRPVGFPITGSSVRYFFESDAPVAARLQEDLPATVAGDARLMDFTSYEPRPRPGTIELWIADPS